jgi:hypothetical protein
MERQHTENLFRRYKGKVISVKCVSGDTYRGRVSEITNDYICLTGSGDIEGSEVFLFFPAIEMMMPVEAATT